MLFTVDLYDTIEVEDPIQFALNKNTNCLNHLNKKFLNRNFNGYHIVEIKKIVKTSSCSIIPSNLNVNGRIYVHFIALIQMVDPYIANLKVYVTKPRITCALDDKSIIAGLIQHDSHQLIQQGQYIPIKVEKSSYDPFKKSITVSGQLLHCDTSYVVYKTSGSLPKSYANELMYRVNFIKKELELRSASQDNNDQSFIFFELLLYSFKHTTKDTQTIKTKDSENWKGPSSIRKVNNTINLLETIKDASESSTEMDMSGYWYRPLELYRSSPLVVRTDEPPADAVIIEQPPHVVIADLINTMMVVKTIRDLAEKFSSKDTMMSHRNIWKLLQSFQK